MALGESQACEESGLWTGVDSKGWEGRAHARDRGAREGLLLAGPWLEGLAPSPDAPQKTPQTIPSYLAKAHIFQSSKTPTTERRKRILWKEEEDEPWGATHDMACGWWRPGGLLPRRPPV